MFAAPARRPPLTFWSKALAALLLVVLADWLFLFHEPGLSIGLFATAWLVLTALTQRALWHDGRAWAALAAALVFALAQVDHVSLLAWVLFCTALGTAVLLPGAMFGDAWRWAQKLLVHGLVALFGPLIDLRRLRKTGRLPPMRGALRLLPLLALPVIGGLVFLLLFASANPLISSALGRMRLPPFSPETVARAIFLAGVLVVVWGSFRARRRRKLMALPEGRGTALPGVTPASVTLSLVVFNLLFGLQNGLDAAFLWSSADLPEGVTLAEYAHRGAYPLIGTAVLAGLFVLVALSPGSETARRPWVRRLVVLWVLQNLFLVASTMLRTIDYIAVYSLTELRIAALAWMALVGVGLALICWRMLRGKSAAWLLNANTAAAGVVLAAASIVDLGAVAARWNVAHASEVGGRGAALDLCYLNGLGGSALVPLTRLEARTPEGAFRDRVSFVRSTIEHDLGKLQASWRSSTLRERRQLAEARRIRREAGVPDDQLWTQPRRCDGALPPPPPPQPPGVTYMRPAPATVVTPDPTVAPPAPRPALTAPAQP